MAVKDAFVRSVSEIVAVVPRHVIDREPSGGIEGPAVNVQHDALHDVPLLIEHRSRPLALGGIRQGRQLALHESGGRLLHPRTVGEGAGHAVGHGPCAPPPKPGPTTDRG